MDNETIKNEEIKTVEIPTEEVTTGRGRRKSEIVEDPKRRKATIKHNVTFYINGLRIYDCDRVILDAEPTGNDIYRLYDRGIFCGTLREGDLDFV